jgi:hypothetical protein
MAKSSPTTEKDLVESIKVLLLEAIKSGIEEADLTLQQLTEYTSIYATLKHTETIK